MQKDKKEIFLIILEIVFIITFILSQIVLAIMTWMEATDKILFNMIFDFVVLLGVIWNTFNLIDLTRDLGYNIKNRREK